MEKMVLLNFVTLIMLVDQEDNRAVGWAELAKPIIRG